MTSLIALTTQAWVMLQRENELLFRSDKIYTVLVVVSLIFSGLIVYLFLTDRKVGKLEKQVEDMVKNSNTEGEESV
ncbi:MAG: hypothetical protein H6581_09670 [Bacteroidia bacterium]|nr:hypothetical protein [Bacteroidia bacterium]